MNKVILRGHLGADPRLNKTTTNSKDVCNFRIATNSTWNDAQGNKQEKVEWHNVVCWGPLALSVGNAMRKGSQVLVDGRNETRSYKKVVQKECTDANKKPGTSAYPAASGAVGPAAVVAASPFIMDGAVVGTTVVQPAAVVAGQPEVVGDPNAVAAAFAQPEAAAANPAVVDQPVIIPGV